MKLSLMITAAAIALAAPASAQSLQDAYGFVYGGISFDGEADFDGDINGGPQTVDIEYDNSGNIGFGVGATLAPQFRGEIELNYTEQDVDRLAFSGNGDADEVNLAGGIEITTLLVNGFYDIETNSPFTPYIGGGIGVAFVDQDAVYGPGIQLSDDDTVFAVQLVAGSSYDLTDSLALTGDVRYRRLFDIETDRLAPDGITNTGLLEGDFDDFSVNVGLRFRF